MRNEDVKLLFVGASIVEGFKSRAPALWARVEARGGLNLGIPGETSGQLLWRVQNGFLRGLQPDVVVLQVGANDRTLPAADVAANIGDIVQAITAQLPRARVLLFTIFPTDKAASPLRAKNTQTNAHLMALHRPPAVTVTECGHLFVDAHGETVPALLPDGLHLSEEAYGLWAGVLFPMLGL